MRKTLAIVIALAGLVMVSAVMVFHFAHGLDWIDSFYFVVTIMTTVGFGDINLLRASPPVKLFGTFVMLASAALMAATFGIVTDYLVRSRLAEYFGLRRSRMRNHIVLCGLGHVGSRILEQLRALGEHVVVVEKNSENRYLDDARRGQTTVIIGDIRQQAVLERANVKEARSLIAATSDDLVNLEAALEAREIRPDIRVVLRIFDSNLASKIRTGFGIKTTFSTSALAAPAFAMAAVDPSVVGSFYVGDDLVLVVQLTVQAGSELDGATVDRLTKDGKLSILCHEAASGGTRRLHPPDSVVVTAGDRLVVTATHAMFEPVKRMNAAGSKA